MSASPDFEQALRSLVDSKVRFVLIGGLAMIAQGTANLTRDIDCLYDRK
jgi:predicted nucleotidyltransferase